MLSLLNSTNWFAKYGLLIVLVVALVVLMLITFNRRRKEDSYRNELTSKIVPGATIKTYYGLYGKVLKITETTDGKILLIETGEGNKVSYQTVHVNAVYAIDEKKDIVYDETGEEVKELEKTEETKKFEELEKKLESSETNKTTKKPITKSETEKIIDEFVNDKKVAEKPIIVKEKKDNVVTTKKTTKKPQNSVKKATDKK